MGVSVALLGLYFKFVHLMYMHTFPKIAHTEQSLSWGSMRNGLEIGSSVRSRPASAASDGATFILFDREQEQEPSG